MIQAWASNKALFDQAISKYVEDYVKNRSVLRAAFDFSSLKGFSCQKR